MSVVDREKECPFLLRIFTRNGGHNPMFDYAPNKVPATGELQLYTWKNATLEELAQLIQEVNLDARHPDARISFRLIYLDTYSGMYRFKEIGRVINRVQRADNSRTLEESKFVVGDYLDVAIFIGPSFYERRRSGNYPPRDPPNSRYNRYPPRFSTGNGSSTRETEYRNSRSLYGRR